MSDQTFNYTEKFSIEELCKDEEAYMQQLREKSKNADYTQQGIYYGLPPGERPKFVVKEVMPIASWVWNATSDTCAICRESLMSPCIQCQAANLPAAKCALSWGECKHGFHTHCLNKWLSSDRTTCPLDNRPWKFADRK